MAERSDALNVARTTVEKVELCVAATAGDGDVANVRVVQRLSFGDDWQITFATDGTSRKAAEIRRTGKLTLSFQDDSERAYVALIGKADVSSDLATKEHLWADHLNRWFPDGPATPNAVIVTLDPERIELWNYAKSIMPEPVGLRAAVLERDGQDWRQTA